MKTRTRKYPSLDNVSFNSADYSLTNYSTPISTTMSTLPSSSSASETLIEKYSDMVEACKNNAELITTRGTAEQGISALKEIKEIQALPATTTIAETAKILAQNEGKKLDLLVTQSSAVNPSISLQPAEETQFKFTFKRKSIRDNQPILNPVNEIYSATDFKVQISDVYTSALGEVICVQTDSDFNLIKEKIFNHSVKSGNSTFPLTDYFDIRAQVVSAFSIKTAGIKRDSLEKDNLLITSDSNPPTLDLDKAITLLLRYNPGWFKQPSDVETIEMFGGKNSNGPAIISLKIHVSRRVFRNFLRKPKPIIMIGTEPVRIFEEVPVVQCLKCCRFEHTADSCKNSSRCRFCGLSDKGTNGHFSRNCKSKNVPKCVNCLDDYAQKNKDPSDIPSHHATSFKCPLLKTQSNLVRASAKQEAAMSFTLEP